MKGMGKIRVLVVDDSSDIRDLLVHILGSDPGIEVVAMAGDGYEAIELAQSVHPDVITMDVRMPRLDGVEAVRMIMAGNPIPTVIVSTSICPEDPESTFRALDAGAIAVCETPQGTNQAEFLAQARNIVQTVKMVSEIPVVRRWISPRSAALRSAAPRSAWPSDAPKAEIVAVGASTGGPPVLCAILSGLAKGFPLPVLIVQHIIPGFLPGMVKWLSATSSIPVRIACDAEPALPGYAYIAPDGVHMKIRRSGRISLAAGDPENGMRPAVSVLFRSMAESFDQSGIGVLLTGMGRDGADELLLMKKKGAVTIAQDKESSVVFGMPGEAIKLGATRFVLPPDRIADMLNESVEGRR
jgi:two-component system chemotaxis response regulator CheB